METIIGIGFLFCGIAGGLFEWVKRQKIKQKRLQEFQLFVKKTMFAMETEHIKLIPYFLQYQCKDEVLIDFLNEVALRLQDHRYPKGEIAWEEVFMEKKQNWDMDEETFLMMIHVGNGLFGKHRTENLKFLQKSVEDMEVQLRKNKERDSKDRTVWIPVGMLGGVMIAILLV